MSDAVPAGQVRRLRRMALFCLLAGVLTAGLLFPVVGGVGVASNRASESVANGSADLVDGDVPAVSTMVDATGNPIAWLYAQRRFEVPSDQIADTMKLAIVSIEDKRFAEHNGVDWQGTLTGLAGYLSGRRRHPRRLDHRAAVRQELSTAGHRRRPTPSGGPRSRPPRPASCARSAWR